MARIRSRRWPHARVGAARVGAARLVASLLVAAVLVPVLVAAWPGRAAASDSAPQFRALAEGLNGEKKTIAPRPSIALTGGGITDLEGGGLAGEVEVGVTWGVFSTGMFKPIRLWRIALAGRVSGLEPDTFAAAALAGRTVDDVLGYTIEGGIVARLSDERELGPVIRLTPRLGSVGLQIGAWWYATASDEVGLSFGITFDAVGMQRRSD